MRLTTQRVTRMLQNIEGIKERLSDERAYIHLLEDFKPKDMLNEMLYRSHENIGRIQNSNISDPTSHIALTYMKAYEDERKYKIEPFIRMHEEEERLVFALETCMKKLDRRDMMILQKTYIERQSPTHISIQAHMTVASLYKVRERTIENLTSLMRTYMAEQYNLVC